MRTLIAIMLGLLLAASAQATSHRTFVAASGTDSGACGPTAPCRSLSYALGQTNDGGEIVITQSGGYGDATGGLVIDRSVAIIAQPGVFAALAPITGNGITIATAGIKVVIKGLNINGRGGEFGIYMTNGASLLVEKTTIAGFTSTNATGLKVQTGATVNVVDSVIRDNYFGIFAGAGATVGISNSKVFNSEQTGIISYTEGGVIGTSTTINISDTDVSGAGWCVGNAENAGNNAVINATRVSATKCVYGFENEPFGGGGMSLSDCTASNNDFGYYNYQGNLTVSGSTASNNGTGFYRRDGAFVSLGNNTVYGNGTDVSGTITAAGLQ